MKSTTNFMSLDQFAMVLSNLDMLNLRKYKEEDVAMLFKITYYCGLRITEAIRLKVEDFDFDTLEVNLGRTKTERFGHASIPHYFVPELQAYLHGKTGRLILANRGIVHQWTVKLGQKLDILAWITPQSETGEKTKSHIFRKSIAKSMLRGEGGRPKAPLPVVAKKLRHSNIMTTSHYVKVDLEEVKDYENSIKVI